MSFLARPLVWPLTACRRRELPFQKGQSGNPGGRPKGSRTFAIRELVAEALADPATGEAAIAEFRRALSRTRTVVPSLEFAARVNKERRPTPDEVIEIVNELSPNGETVPIPAVVSRIREQTRPDVSSQLQPS